LEGKPWREWRHENVTVLLRGNKDGIDDISVMAASVGNDHLVDLMMVGVVLSKLVAVASGADAEVVASWVGNTVRRVRRGDKAIDGNSRVFNGIRVIVFVANTYDGYTVNAQVDRP